jgi:hypothetical protein
MRRDDGSFATSPPRQRFHRSWRQHYSFPSCRPPTRSAQCCLPARTDSRCPRFFGLRPTFPSLSRFHALIPNRLPMSREAHRRVLEQICAPNSFERWTCWALAWTAPIGQSRHLPARPRLPKCCAHQRRRGSDSYHLRGLSWGISISFVGDEDATPRRRSLIGASEKQVRDRDTERFGRLEKAPDKANGDGRNESRPTSWAFLGDRVARAPTRSYPARHRK